MQRPSVWDIGVLLLQPALDIDIILQSMGNSIAAHALTGTRS